MEGKDIQTSGTTSSNSAKWARRGLDIGTGVSAIYPLLLTTSLFGDPVDCCSSSSSDDELETAGGGDNDDDDTDHTTTTSKCHHRRKRQWTFLASDIDPVAIESARINIQANCLEDRIQLILVNADANDPAAVAAAPSDDKSTEEEETPPPRGPLFAAMSALRERSYPVFDGNDDDEKAGSTMPEEEELLLSQYPKLDFVMTNPPFYASLKEATLPRAGDKRARTDMSTNESVYQRTTATATTIPTSIENGVDADDDDDDGGGGGDVGFISSIIDDSQYFRHHVTWYTSLIAKRSSLETLLRRLETLDGVWGNRGQIRTVEFRQRNLEGGDNAVMITKERVGISSPRVRWGIGWTYERASGRCSSCRIRGGLQSFEVWVHTSSTDGVDDDDDDDDDDDTILSKSARDEVASRLCTYFENVRDIPLKCLQQMREYGDDDVDSPRGIEQSAWCITALEERFCNSIPSCSNGMKNANDNENLPIEGHFVIDAFLECNDNTINANGEVCVRVILEMFSHTKYGSACIDKIRNSLPGEIGRTNRRWRRLLKHSIK